MGKYSDFDAGNFGVIERRGDYEHVMLNAIRGDGQPSTATPEELEALRKGSNFETRQFGFNFLERYRDHMIEAAKKSCKEVRDALPDGEWDARVASAVPEGDCIIVTKGGQVMGFYPIKGLMNGPGARHVDLGDEVMVVEPIGDKVPEAEIEAAKKSNQMLLRVGQFIIDHHREFLLGGIKDTYPKIKGPLPEGEWKIDLAWGNNTKESLYVTKGGKHIVTLPIKEVLKGIGIPAEIMAMMTKEGLQ